MVWGTLDSLAWHEKITRSQNALADLQKNSGVLSEGLVLGNLGLGLWQRGSPISVRLLSREEESSDFPPRNER